METIKASELRIGNLVKDRGGKTLSIDRFYGNKIEMNVKGMPSSENGIPLYYHPLTEEISYCQPIPLTEEWLLKFGFEKNSYWFKDDNMLRFGLIDNKLHCSIGNDENGFLYNRINYVHQLQNLYFALTGQELEFKQ
jgi:hypothetical protein